MNSIGSRRPGLALLAMALVGALLAAVDCGGEDNKSTSVNPADLSGLLPRRSDV